MSDAIILYHGTTREFTDIDVSKGKPFKDFGSGFYATEVYEHAQNMAVRNRRIEESRYATMGENCHISAYVYVFEINMNDTGGLRTKRFDSADRKWLLFVIRNRTNIERQHNYDLVIGPTANDDTRTSIRTVTSAANGAIFNDAALDLLLIMLEPEKLPMQYYFGTEEAVKYLTYKDKHKL